MNDKNAGIKDNNKLMCVSLLVYTLSLPWLMFDPGLVVVAFITWAAIGIALKKNKYLNKFKRNQCF